MRSDSAASVVKRNQPARPSTECFKVKRFCIIGLFSAVPKPSIRSKSHHSSSLRRCPSCYNRHSLQNAMQRYREKLKLQHFYSSAIVFLTTHNSGILAASFGLNPPPCQCRATVRPMSLCWKSADPYRPCTLCCAPSAGRVFYLYEFFFVHLQSKSNMFSYENILSYPSLYATVTGVYSLLMRGLPPS